MTLIARIRAFLNPPPVVKRPLMIEYCISTPPPAKRSLNESRH